MTQRKAYDLMVDAFGPGVNGPLLVAVALPQPTSSDGAEQTALTSLATAIGQTPGVKSASAPIPNSNGTAAIIEVTPTTGPTQPATADLVRTLRNDTIPKATANGPVPASDVAVGGTTAVSIDLTELIQSRLLPFIAGVIIGGTSLLGGRGSIIGTLLGSILLGILSNAFILLRLNPEIQVVSLGLVIVLAALVDQWRMRRSGS